MKAFPAVRDKDHTTIFTHWGHLHHVNAVPVSRAEDAISMAWDITQHAEDEGQIALLVMSFLSDSPVEPLIGANAEQKASILGLISLGYLLRQERHEQKIRRMLGVGDGVALVEFHGDLDRHEVVIRLFEDWAHYQAFLQPILSNGDMNLGKASTLL
ncbi:hypothetical protein PQR46_32535 [Paraburkholderia sediminicola]|uniref:hypothetical protein n=1 Tax=Paraburkholderia sediminicola TaxID=458836 RepID=UPI0038BC3016